MDKETGNQDATVPEPHKISHKLSYKSQQLDIFSDIMLSGQGFMAAQRSCFIKQGRPAVASHTIVRRRTRCIPTSDQALCPVGIFRRKAASKADSAPPMSHPMQQAKALQAVQKHRMHATKCRRTTSCVELIHPF